MARYLDYLFLALGTVAAVACLGTFLGQVTLYGLLSTSFYILGLLGCGLLVWLGRCRIFAYPGMLSSATGIGMMVWGSLYQPLPVPLPEIPLYPAAFCCYAGAMMAVAPRGPLSKLVAYPAIGVAGLFVANCVFFIADGYINPLLGWSTYVSGALACLMAFGLLPISMWERSRRHPGPRSTSTSVSLRCPRCGEYQAMAQGRRRCQKCKLVITFEIEEPRCAGCGFVLFTIAGDKCPECGRAVPAEERWSSPQSEAA